jgi:hypothetical protein
VSELSPHGTDSCQTLLVGLILSLAAACSEPPRRNYTRTQPDDPPSMHHRPIETERTGRGGPRVEATVQEPEPLTGAVEIRTWADEVIRGRILAERPDGFDLDVGPLDGSNPKLRKVSRAAVMELKKLRRAP